MFYTSFRAAFETCVYLDHVNIVAGYTRITTLTYPCRTLLIDNWTDGDLIISFDYVHDHLPVHSDSSRIIDITSNAFSNNTAGIFVLPAGTEVWVKLAPGQVVNQKGIYISSIYGSTTL